VSSGAGGPPAVAGQESAPAKVNLFLRVTGRRDDGYHLLESLAVFAGTGDVLHAEPADSLSLTLRGPFAAGLGAGPDNLVLRAARALAEAAGVSSGATLTLEKHLPVASGIGGGSSDAAAALRLLARLWGLGEVPPGLALRLGADVPVCLRPAPLVMRGVGEALSPAPALPEYGLALVNPGVAVATADVFRQASLMRTQFSPRVSLPACWPSAGALAQALAELGNDLQAPAMALCPAIQDVLAALRRVPGCLLAQMSGSGATCFGIFATPSEAKGAAALGRIAGWWAWGGAPLSGPVPADVTLQGLPEAAA
jgi:4-diphosphocytidyl-2-C-methyl-D-erythritol kinase